MSANERYTSTDVALRNGKNGRETWLIIRDGVYDVTSFLKDHPGGPELILEWAGKDATKEFESVGHSSDALKELKNYKIGVLDESAGSEEPKLPTPSSAPVLDVLESSIKAMEASIEPDAPKKKRKCFLFC